MNWFSLMIKDRLEKTNLTRYAFGWNYKAWSHAFLKIDLPMLKKNSRLLEVGASRHSIVSIIFDGLVDEIVVSYYQQDEKENIEKYLSFVQKNYRLKSRYVIEKIDARTVVGDFDIVIMKSVLGGLFRENQSTMADVSEFLASLFARTVNPGGSIISIDNGKSLFDWFIPKLGARRNLWRLFRKSDLNWATKKCEFGVLSFFSFETRLGYFGFLLDNYIVYPVDVVFFRFWKYNPTVIVSLFRGDNK